MDATIIACGIMVDESLKAAELLSEENIEVRVINMSTIKPLDIKTIKKAAKETGAIVTAEDHSCLGGLGGAVAEAVSEAHPVPIVRVGIQDTFGESGEHLELMAKYGLTSKEIVQAARTIVRAR